VTSSLVGRTLGTYQITDLLGQGGMATVYKGYRADIDRYVAIKVLPPHPGLDQGFIERFKLEARTIARLQHPHILPLYDYGVEDGILYLVMAYIEGGSLGGRIKRGRMDPLMIGETLRQVASALDYAHRQGVIHRDIKPDNILLDKEGFALLADFGIVKLAEDVSNRLTVTGGMVGTPAYMAPEQGSGAPITPSADLYSLGVVVYEMLTGRQPYSADTPMQVVIKHMTEPVPSLRTLDPGFSPDLDGVMQRALSKNPEVRYPTATAFAEDFNRAIQGRDVAVAPTAAASFSLSTLPLTIPTQPVATQPTNPLQATNPQQPTVILQQGTNPLLLLGGFAIIAVLLVAVVLLVTRPDSHEQDPPPTATLSSAPTNPPPQVAAATAPPSFGRVSFSTTRSVGDTLTLQVENLRPPQPGDVYIAWLKNTESGDALKIGELTLDALGSGVLPPFVDPEGHVLPALYNAVTITSQKAGGLTAVGNPLYRASVPPQVSKMLANFYVSDPNGIAVSALSGSSYNAPVGQSGATSSLIDSLLAEAKRAAEHIDLAQHAQSIGGMHVHNEHSVNILMGTLNDYNADGRSENPGYQKGAAPYLTAMRDYLTQIATAPGSDAALQSSIEWVRVCVDNSQERVDQIIGLEQVMLAATDLTAITQQATDATLLAGALLKGVDANGNGQVEPFEEECGLEQIRDFALLMSGMRVLEVPK
jgi:serine/threonine protein kinase